MPSFVSALKLGGAALILLPAFITMAQTCNTSTITPTTDHLVDNNNGTVNDPITGLIWKKCSEGQSYNSGSNDCDNNATSFTWSLALQQAQDINAGSIGENLGQTDWRVPNINELSAIAELSCLNPAINMTVFPNTPSSLYWSSSPNANFSYHAWVLYFSHGYDGTFDKNYGWRLRLVRSGQ